MAQGGGGAGGGSWPEGLCASVRATVDVHRPADEREGRARDRIVADLRALVSPFDRKATPVHITGSAVLVGPRGTVLHMHKRLHRWLQPGGHLDPGEPPSDAALRESQEETGLALTHPVGGPRLIHLDVHDAADGHTHLDLRYLLIAPDQDPVPPAGESSEARWFGWDEADGVADEALIGALRAARLQPEAQVEDRAAPQVSDQPGSRGAVGPGRWSRHNGGDGTDRRGAHESK